MEKANTIQKQKVITGGDIPQKWLKSILNKSMEKAESIDLVVSFLMESGVRLILPDLIKAAKKNIPIQILTGNYLNITEPSALYLIKSELGDMVDLRFYNNPSRSFHPKAYLIHHNNSTDIFIGSSNLSYSALTTGIEWNYQLNSEVDKESVKIFIDTFNDLFQNHSIVIDDAVLKNYSKNWHRPKLYNDLEKIGYDDSESIVPLFTPRGFQIEALTALKQTRLEGADKALIQAATGTGKTFLAAFDSMNFSRILFVAHRNEILNQAAETFKKVHPNKSLGFFNSQVKDCKSQIIFASVATLGQDKYLNNDFFSSEDFDYIIIDEFHHAVTRQYQNIINYFKPKFLLGLTATPERLDRKNIFEITDYNVPYQLDIFEAINKGLLSPFRYYGIYDDSDYNQVVFKNGKYQEKSLNQLYLNNFKRDQLILGHYLKHNPKRSIGFCSSKKHAEYMAELFSKNNIPAVAVHSGGPGKFTLDREEALKQLKNGNIKIIFSVDIFNEGLDIPDIDCVLFLRPTESPVVFFQQLGRGLRKAKYKNYLTVLDFLGNYKNAFKIPKFLSNTQFNYSSLSPLSEMKLPDDCFVDFDLALIDLFREQQKSQLSRKQLIIEDYYRIKKELGHRPSRIELFTMMPSELYDEAYHLKNYNNPFKNYFGFLEDLNELSENEKIIFQSIAYDFLHLIETTSMTRVYKMPVLMSFIDNDHLIENPSKERLIFNWKSFFNKRTNFKDLSYVNSKEEFESVSDKIHLNKIKRMPIKFLIKSGKGFFEKTDSGLIKLSSQLIPFLNSKVVVNELEDIIQYRTLEYYRKKYLEEI